MSRLVDRMEAAIDAVDPLGATSRDYAEAAMGVADPIIFHAEDMAKCMAQLADSDFSSATPETWRGIGDILRSSVEGYRRALEGPK